ncbi:MAG: GNAT family N-acetyltransferase [Candidatus Pacebacteria bacterium]|nr:GNAT family N-acetyltransferase [Candidatus Paceibacterota bacterium]MCD8528249.1 GNAT family N-acetyltransferase [Candidatus Paceibacterota bacterium]
MKTSYIFKLLSSLDDNERSRVLSFWAAGTECEEHMITETPASLQENLLEGFIAYTENGDLVGCAGIFPARTKYSVKIIFASKDVVELGSNYIEPAHRNRGLGKQLLIQRIAYCRQRNYFIVSVTLNPAMQHIFCSSSAGAHSMDNQPEYYQQLKQDLCVCREVSDACRSCPLQKNGGWVF